MDEDYNPSQRSKRPYIKKQTNNAPGIRPPTSPPQIPDLAYNIHGWALEDGMIGRSLHEVINAYKPTMTKGGFEAKIRSLESEGVRGIYRQDLQYTQRELNPHLARSDNSIAQYLVVGYTLQEDDPVFLDNKTFQRYSEGELVGEERPSGDHLISWHEIRTPIIVVSPIKENTGTSVRLFGLIQPVSGLCHPVLLTHERIFYRWEYRASAGAKHAQRNKNWNQVIIDKARELTPADQLVNYGIIPQLTTPRPSIKRSGSEPLIKQEEDEGAYDGVGIDLPDEDIFELNLELDKLYESLLSRQQNVSNVDEIPLITTRIKIELNPKSVGILLSIRKSNSWRLSKEVEACIKKVTNAMDIPGVQHHALAQFQYPGAVLDQETAQMAVAEAISLWPQLLTVLHADVMIRVKTIMNFCGVSLSPEQTKSFLFQVVRFLRQNALYSEDLLRRTIEYWGQHAETVPQLTQGDIQSLQMDTVYLVTLLKELLSIHVWQERMVVPFLENNTPPTFSTSIFEHYITIEDIESASAALQDTLKGIVNYARTKNCKIDDIQLWLERLRLRIRQV